VAANEGRGGLDGGFAVRGHGLFLFFVVMPRESGASSTSGNQR
jgi:hypothetical protein